ncbi:MAG: divalent metal cation transporter [Bacterioplanes sp.]|nr:divalent metal cation transporter [Bacterioplanes sp.]
MTSSLRSSLSALGPGILMATAAVGGSHLVASTQAGALFGWQLIGLILLVNILKYPFFRLAVQYTVENGESLLHGYQRKGRGYFYSFIVLSMVAAIANTAGVLLITASLLSYALPWSISVTVLCFAILAVCLLILMLGHYQALDSVAKIIMALLTIATIAAAVIAAQQGTQAPVDFQGPSPWQLAMIGFLVALMGWMPIPIEFSAINSLWLTAKQRQQNLNQRQALLDFNIGYGLTALLALVFLALGALVQYGSEQPISMAGVAFAEQLIGMYSNTIGEWARPLISAIAFLCMFGTTLTVLDGYARGINESFMLLGVHQPGQRRSYYGWLLAQAIAGMAVVLFFRSSLGPMLTFAMTLAFLTTPVFAWLNYRLMRDTQQQPLHPVLVWWSRIGLVYLIGFALLFIAWHGFK